MYNKATQHILNPFLYSPPVKALRPADVTGGGLERMVSMPCGLGAPWLLVFVVVVEDDDELPPDPRSLIKCEFGLWL